MPASDLKPDGRHQSLDRVVLIGGRPDRALGLLADELRNRRVSVELLAPGTEAREHVQRVLPNCLVVDFRAGDAAREFAGWYCKQLSDLVLVITDQRDVMGRLHGLELGTADHMIAPFALGEAVARVEVLLTRGSRRGSLQLGDIVVDPAQRVVVRGATPIPLTPRELDVLVLLMRNRGRITSKQELMDEIWTDKPTSPNAVEAAVSSLRRKLHRPGHEIIRTVHRAGYALRVPTNTVPSRATMIVERDRLLRERDDALARRDKIIRRLRDEIDVAAGETHALDRRGHAAGHRDGRDDREG